MIYRLTNLIAQLIGVRIGKALQEQHIYWSLQWYFFNELIEYDIMK